MAFGRSKRQSPSVSARAEGDVKLPLDFASNREVGLRLVSLGLRAPRAMQECWYRLFYAYILLPRPLFVAVAVSGLLEFVFKEFVLCVSFLVCYDVGVLVIRVFFWRLYRERLLATEALVSS